MEVYSSVNATEAATPWKADNNLDLAVDDASDLVIDHSESDYSDVSLDVVRIRDRIIALFNGRGNGESGRGPSIMARVKDELEEISLSRSISVRPAQPRDLSRLVEVDMLAFKSVYRHYDKPLDELKAELLDKFRGRFDKVGSDWITVLEKEKQVIGFLMACPTNKAPEDFVSWENNTDNGTLESTYVPNGKYIFIVSLSVLREGSNLDGQNMLALEFISKITAQDYLAYFESRVPGMKRWVQHKCAQDNIRFSELTPEQERSYADEYFINNVIKGQYNDPLLRLYHDIGCRFVKLVPNAYQDELSLNYGVVATIQSPLPDYLQTIPAARKLVAKAMSTASRSMWLTRKVI